MSARTSGACALLAVALALAGSACGGGSSRGQAAQRRADVEAAAHWRTGLLAWRREMTRALDGISLLLGTQVSVADLSEAHSQQSASLSVFEVTLSRCRATVERLGPGPAQDTTARGYALAACASLERGDRMIDGAVNAFMHGSLQALDVVTPPLSSGQSEMDVATGALVSASPGQASQR